MNSITTEANTSALFNLISTIELNQRSHLWLFILLNYLFISIVVHWGLSSPLLLYHPQGVTWFKFKVQLVLLEQVLVVVWLVCASHLVLFSKRFESVSHTHLLVFEINHLADITLMALSGSVWFKFLVFVIEFGNFTLCKICNGFLLIVKLILFGTFRQH